MAWLFDFSPTCCIYPATSNLSDNPSTTIRQAPFTTKCHLQAKFFLFALIVFLGIPLNSTLMRIHLCKAWQLYNYFKIRLGGSEICLPDVNMQYNYCYQFPKNVFPGIQYNRFVLLVITGLHC